MGEGSHSPFGFMGSFHRTNSPFGFVGSFHPTNSPDISFRYLHSHVLGLILGNTKFVSYLRWLLKYTSNYFFQGDQKLHNIFIVENKLYIYIDLKWGKSMTFCKRVKYGITGTVVLSVLLQWDPTYYRGIIGTDVLSVLLQWDPTYYRGITGTDVLSVLLHWDPTYYRGITGTDVLSVLL